MKEKERLLMTERKKRVCLKIGGVFGITSLVLAFLAGWALLWGWEIHSCGGISDFMQAFSWEGIFFPPPGFWLIKIFYHHPYLMSFCVGVTSLGLGILADKYSHR